jgi:hypothetical protein
MYLKSFHIFLISCAIAFNAGLGFWGIQRHAATQKAVDLWTAAGGFMLALFLAAYLIWFLRKIKQKGW